MQACGLLKKNQKKYIYSVLIKIHKTLRKLIVLYSLCLKRHFGKKSTTQGHCELGWETNYKMLSQTPTSHKFTELSQNNLYHNCKACVTIT